MYNGPGGEIEETQAAAGITATAGRDSHQTLCHSICDQIRGSSRTGIRVPRKLASMMPSWAPISTTAYGAKIMPRDRKSTRLNSSHVAISYAVFCLKKKTKRVGEDGDNKKK